MGLVRLVIGAAIAFTGVALGAAYGIAAYSALVGTGVDARVTGPCTRNSLVVLEAAAKCPAVWWTADGEKHWGDLLVATTGTVSARQDAKALSGTAYVPPTGAGLVLGYLSLPVLLVGLKVMTNGHRPGQDGGGGGNAGDGGDGGGDGGGGDGGGGG